MNVNGFTKQKILDDDEIDNILSKMILMLKNYCDYYNITYINADNNTDLLYNMLHVIFDFDKELYFHFVKQSGVFSDIYQIKSLFDNNKILKFMNDLGYNNISVPCSPQVNLYCDFAVSPSYRNGEIGIDTHQDWPQARGSINGIIIWIPLMDINDDNCPLLCVKKSHLKGFQNGNLNINAIVPMGYNESDFDIITLEKGEGLAFSPWLIHKTGKFRNNGKIRIAITVRFNDLNDNYFISTGYKTSYIITTNKDKNQTRIPYHDEVLKYYQKCEITHFTDLYNKRKFWYETNGKYMQNPYEKLISLHRYIKCNDMSRELHEQILILKYLDPKSKVLELGGNIGRVSLIIATVLDNDSNLVVIEPTKEISDINIKNREINCFKYNVETKVLSKSPLFLKRNLKESVANKTSNIEDDESELVENIQFSELQDKYNIIFDTIIIDCEGAFYFILKDFPNILNNINTIIIENDFETKEEYNEIYKTFISSGFNLIETKDCYPINANGINRQNMHQVFKKII